MIFCATNPRCQRPLRGFTLVEVMVSTVVLAIMLLLISSVISQTQKSWRRASTRLTQFREARLAFDTVTRNLQQATLNAYRDHYYASTKKNYPAKSVEDPKQQEYPTGSRRTSELAFVTGRAADIVVGSGAAGPTDLPGHAIFFQAPLGVTDPETGVVDAGTGQPRYQSLKSLLCTRGYFMMNSDDKPFLPEGLVSRLESHVRLRLMEFQPPAETDQIYASRDVPGATGGPNDWMRVNPTYLRPLTEHVVGLVISPLLASGTKMVNFSGRSVEPTSIARNYVYDSRLLANVVDEKIDPQGTQHLLPPVVRVTMVALDSDSLAKLEREKKSADMLAAAGAAFTDATSYANDLAKLKTYLNEQRLAYRIFEATILIPAARKFL